MRASVKRQGKAPTADEVRAELAKVLPGATDPQYEGRGWTRALTPETEAEFEAYRERRLASLEEEDTKAKEAERLRAQQIRVRDMLRTLPVGQPVYMRTEDGNYYGVVTNIQQAKGKGSPFAPSRWKVEIAVADPMRKLTLSASNWDAAGIEFDTHLQLSSAMQRFTEVSEVGSSEERYLITGNVPAGFSAIGAKGKVVFFTDHQGDTKAGVLMPRTFQDAKQAFDRPVELRTPEHVIEFAKRSGKHAFGPDELAVSATPSGRVEIKTAGSKAKGGSIFLNPGVLNALGAEFVKQGNRMVVTVDEAPARAALARIIDLVGPLEAKSEKDIGYEITGQAKPVVEKASKEGRFEAEPKAKEAAPETVEFHAGLPLGKLWDWFLGPMFAKHYEPLGTLPNRAKYLAPRYRAQGKADEVDQIARNLYRQLDKHDGATKEQIYQYLTTPEAAPGMIRNPQARREAITAKRLIDLVGRELVDRGALDREQYEKYADRYLPRIYLKYMFETEGVYMGAGNRPQVSGEMMGRLKKRKDISAFERDVLLGEIKDPAYLVSRAFGTAAHSIAIWDFYREISTHSEWIYPGSMVDWNGRQVTPRWLVAEAERLRRMRPMYPEHMQAAVRDTADEMEAIARDAIGDPPDPKAYQQVPDTKRYGHLRGLWVRKEIYDDFVQSANPQYPDTTLQHMANLGRRANSVWKGLKTAWSISGQARNFMGGRKRSSRVKNAWVRWFAIRQGRIAGKFANNRWEYKIPKKIRDRVRGQLAECVVVFDKAIADGIARRKASRNAAILMKSACRNMARKRSLSTEQKVIMKARRNRMSSGRKDKLYGYIAKLALVEYIKINFPISPYESIVNKTWANMVRNWLESAAAEQLYSNIRSYARTKITAL